jgi:hypothetical protein
MVSERPEAASEESPRALSPPVIGGLVAAVTALALALRLARLGEAALWYDEAFGLLIARMPWGEMNRTILTDVHPPLWFWLLHLWGTDSVLWARGLNVAIGTLNVPLVWVLMRRPLGERAALMGAALLAIHPVSVYHSQELRMYALEMLLITLVLAAALPCVRDRSVHAGRWIALGLLAWAALWTQYIALAAASGVWAGMAFARRRRLDSRWICGWALSGLMAVLSASPWVLLSDWGHVVRRDSGLPNAAEFLYQLIAGNLGEIHTFVFLHPATVEGRILFGAAVATALLALALVGHLALSRRPGNAAVAWTLGMTLLGGVGVLVALQIFGLSIRPRHFAAVFVPQVLLAASALQAGPMVWRVGGATLVALALLGHTLGQLSMYGTYRSPAVRIARAIEILDGDQRPSLVCTHPYLAVSLRALLPEHTVWMTEREDTIPAQRRLLGEGHVISTWPHELHGKSVHLVHSGLGAPPPTESEARQEVGAVLSRLGHPPSQLRHVYQANTAGGTRWAHLFEVR